MRYIPFAIALTSISTLALAGAVQPQNERMRDHASRDSQTEASPERTRAERPPKKMLEIRINADALRTRLKRSILRAEEMLERNRSALEKLDAGASPSEVLSEMRAEGYSRDSQRPQFEPVRARPQASKNIDQSPRQRPVLSPEERRQLHQFLSTNFPKLSDNLKQIVKVDKRSADRLLARMAPQIREILYLEKNQPELSKIKTEEMRIGLEFVEASRIYRALTNNPNSTESEIAEASDRLSGLAAERFDIKAKAHQFEIDRLEARLNELKASVDQIQQGRDAEIAHMVNNAKHSAKRTPKNHAQDNAGARSGND
jgi:hypothetical protein